MLIEATIGVAIGTLIVGLYTAKDVEFNKDNF